MLNLNTSQYFNSLPVIVQESIKQSGIDFDSEDELRIYAKDYINA